MGNEVAIKITADGKAAVVAAQDTTTALGTIERQAGKTGDALNGSQKSSAGLNASLLDMGKAGVVFGTLSSMASGLADAMQRLPTSGVQFAAQIEVTNVGMAGILSSMTAINGQSTSYVQGLEIASGIAAKLQRDAMMTAANTQELVSAFQAMVGPGLAAGMTLEQIPKLTTVGVNAVKSMGLAGNQVVQELRDLVQGGITASGSTLATALGLKDTDIAKAKSSSEGLFKFLMDRMAGFDAAGQAYSQTFRGTMENMQEQLVKSSATVMAPLADILKTQAKGITDALGNEENVAQLSRLTGSIQVTVSALGQATQFAIQHSEAIVTVAQVYAAIKFGTMVAGWQASAVAMMESSAASRLLTIQSAAEAVGNTEVTLTARQKIAAYLAELVAKEASAQATVAETAGKISFLSASVAALELSRSEVVAKMASTRTTIAQAEAQLAAATAAGAQSYALAMVTQATNTLSGAQVRQSALMAELALLGSQQTGVHAAIATATAAQAAATEGAALATNQLGAAQRAASVSSGAMGSALGALGGPVGVAIAAVSVLVGFLLKMNSEADKAALVGVAKDRLNSGKADAESSQIVATRLSELKRQALELEADKKTPGVMAFLFGADYESGMKNQAGTIAAEISMLEETTAHAAASASTVGTGVQLKAAGATKTLDDLLAKQKTVKSLTDAARLEDAALEAELARVRSNSNVSSSVVAAKEVEVANAKRANGLKLQNDIKALKASENAIDVEAAKVKLDATISYYEQLQAIVTSSEKQAQERLKAQHDAKLITDEDYFAQEQALALSANAGIVTLTQLEIEAVKQSGIAKKDKLKDVEKYTSELSKLKQEEIGIHTHTDDELIKLDGKRRAHMAKSFEEWDEKSKKEREKVIQSVGDYARAIDEQNAQTQLELSLAGSTAQAREIALGKYKVELDLKKQLAAIDAVQGQGEFFDQWKAEQRANAVAAAARASAGVESRVYVDEWKKTSEQINQSLTDALMRGFEDGKGFAENMRDTIVNMFKTLILRPVISAVISPVAQSLTGALGFGSSSANIGAASNTVSGWSNLASIGGAGFQWATGSLAGASSASLMGANAVGAVGGDAMGALIAGNGGWAGVSTAATAGEVGALGTAAGAGSGFMASAAAAAPYIAAAMVAYSLLSGDDGSSVKTTGEASTVFDAGGKATAHTNRYGEVTSTTNFIASMQASYSEAAKALGITTGETFFRYGSNVQEDGKNAQFALGGMSGNNEFYQAETLTTPGAVELAASRAVFAALQGSELPKYLAGAFDGLAAGAMTQEQITATLAGAQAVKTFHEQLQLLPFESLKDLSYAATQNLIGFAGGIDKLGSSLSVYYDKFYTADEKTALLTQNTAASFAALGQVMPALDASTRSNYRALVEELAAKDLSVAANARAYSGALALASAVDQLAPALVDTAKAAADSAKLASDAAKEAIATAQASAKSQLDSVTGGASDALSALSRAVSAQKAIDQADYEAKKAVATAAFTSQSELLKSSIDSVNASLSDVGKSIGKLQSLSGTLKSTLDGMRIAGSDSTYRASAQAQISAALATVRSGGTLPLDGQLSSALATVSKPSEKLFSSFEDYARDFYRTANDISALSSLTDSQLTADQVTQGILTEQSKTLAEQKALLKDGFDAQVSSLDAILSNAQQQLDAASGINTSVLSVAAALSQFNASILSLTAERAAQDLATSRGTTYTNDQIVASVKGALADGYSVADVYGGAAKNYGIGASTITAATSGQGIAGFDSGTAAADKYSQEQMAAWLQAAAAGGYSVADMYSHALSDYGVGGAVLSKAGKQAGLPGFAAGINYVPHDMDARIHKGEAVVPEVYNPFNPNAKAVGGGGGRTNTARLEALIEKLTEKVALLEAPAKRTADNTKQFASQFNKVTEGGRAIQTEVYV